MRLCLFCKNRNISNFPECKDEECELCKGTSARVEQMIEEALGLIPKEWKKFAISTNIDPKIMAAEENVWDYGLGKSIKHDFNKRIADAICKRTGMDYDSLHVDGKITLDFVKNEVRVENANIFIFGRYKKYRTDLAQSEWVCKKCNGKGCEKCGFNGVMYNSVEAIMCEAAKEIYGAKDGELHASGREDVDVINIAGRPFVLELRKPKKGKLTLREFAHKVNEAKKGVEVQDLHYVSNLEVALVADSHFDKVYEAEVEIEGFEEKDVEKIAELGGKIIEQRTPERVAHRRKDLVRKRRILKIEVLETKPLRLRIRAEAGTYIKEFISGDKGRTKPSISEILGKNAKCIKLSVSEIYDDFIDEVLGVM